MIEIQSRQNAALKHLARLGRERKYRRSTGEMLCEGEKMLTEALRSGAEIKTVLVRRGFESGELRQAEKQGAAMYCAEDALFRLASEVESPQNVIFSCMQPQWDAAALDDREQVLLLDGLQDPGNLGTILRTADAMGAVGLLLGSGCADPYAPKPLRAAMGSIYHMPVWQGDLPTEIEKLKRQDYTLVCGHLKGEGTLPAATERMCLVIGNEGNGVSDNVADMCHKYRLPMYGFAESLNAAVILIYELARGMHAE